MTENFEKLSISSDENSSIDISNVTNKETLKRIIEIQKEQNKANKEMIENQRKMMEEQKEIIDEQRKFIEKLLWNYDEKSGRKRELMDNDDFIKNPVKRVDTSAVDNSGNGENEADTSEKARRDDSIENPAKRADLDTSAKEKSGQGENVVSTGLLSRKDVKCFMLKHTFTKVSKLKNGVKVHSEDEEHFGISWRMFICRNKEHLEFYIRCQNKSAKGVWSIEAERELMLWSKNGRPLIRKTCDLHEQNEIEKIRNPSYWGCSKFEKWDEVEKKFLIHDTLTFVVFFKVKNMKGIYKDDLRSFNDPDCSDIVLIAQNKKFQVSKLYLATHSPYFKEMFIGMIGDDKKPEIPLAGVNADDFQNYLEVLYGDDAVDEHSVEGILMIADIYDTPLAMRKCEEFLVEKSIKTMIKKLDLAEKYRLENLKKQCVVEFKASGKTRPFPAFHY